MEVGGRGSLAHFRRPLTDFDVEAGSLERERTREGPGHGSHSSVRASSPHGRASPGTSPKMLPSMRQALNLRAPPGRHRPAQTDAVVAAALSGAGRRLPGLGAPSRRAPAVKREVDEVRRVLDDNLYKDGECYAVCMAGGLDLARLAKATLALKEVGTDSVRSQASIELEEGKASDAKGHALAELSPDRSFSDAAQGDLFGLGGAGLVRHFGTGENIVLHLQFFGKKDVYAFGFGCIVCWSCDQTELDELRSKMQPFLVRPQPRDGVEEETMNFVLKRGLQEEPGGEEEEEDGEAAPEDDEAKCIVQDKIILAANSPLEKLAHSYALAQSVRLGGFELVVERSIAETRSIPETLAETGEVKLEARELAKQMGELLMLRCDVNLHTDILDTPDIFWDEERFEKIYVACRTYLDIDKRVDILNQRLVVLKDLYDLLQNSLNVKHGTKLEWIVIILILVEVVLEIIQLYFTPGG